MLTKDIFSVVNLNAPLWFFCLCVIRKGTGYGEGCPVCCCVPVVAGASACFWCGCCFCAGQ